MLPESYNWNIFLAKEVSYLIKILHNGFFIKNESNLSFLIFNLNILISNYFDLL